MRNGNGTVLSDARSRGGASNVARDGGSVALAIRVDQLHGSRRGNGSHTTTRDTAGLGASAGRAGHQVSGGIAALLYWVSHCFVMRRVTLRCDNFATGMQHDPKSHGFTPHHRSTTYRALNTALKIAALETRQEKVGGVGRHGGSAGHDSDSVEAHIEEYK